MYLRECLVENIGPIRSLDVSFSMNEEGNPKPVVLVGPNGTGKTIFLSFIADALIEFAKTAYRDVVVPQPTMQSPYFRVLSPLNVTWNCKFGIALLEFLDKDKKFSYIEKTGKLDVDTFNAKLKKRFQAVSPRLNEANCKAVLPGDVELFQRFFAESAVCFFPSSRSEMPHWLIPTTIGHEGQFKIEKRFHGNLSKPIFIESGIDETKRWVLDVIFDSRMEVAFEGDRIIAFGDPNLQRSFKNALVNIESLLGDILQEESIHLKSANRSSADVRLCVAKGNDIVIPGLEYLSSGQSILFAIFATILRYAERSDVTNSSNLGQIQGIVLVDEVDAHLHNELQYNVLPRLIKRLPKVQFILTTHSPIFVLGMEKEYGSTGFHIVEMPSGTSIGPERFSEFQKAYDYFKQSSTYHEDLKGALEHARKDVVFVEGDNDIRYLGRAASLLGQQEILDRIELGDGEGLGGLDKIWKHFDSRLAEFSPPKVILIYDCDSSKQNADRGRIVKWVVPPVVGNPIAKGIENLFPKTTIERARAANPRFIDVTPEVKKLVRGREEIQAEVLEVNKDEKRNLCDWLCAHGTENDFRGFMAVFGLIKDSLEKRT